MSLIPAISYQPKQIVSETKVLPAIVVNESDCAACESPNPLPGIKVTKNCDDTCNDSGAAGNLSNYPYIGYVNALTTATYTTDADWIFPQTFWIVIDNNYEFVGTATSLSNLVELLNVMELGTFSVAGLVITAVGYHDYGQMIPQGETQAISEEVKDIGVIWSANLLQPQIADQLVSGRLALVQAIGFQHIYLTIYSQNDTDAANAQTIANGGVVDIMFDPRYFDNTVADWIADVVQSDSAAYGQELQPDVTTTWYYDGAVSFIDYVDGRFKVILDGALLYRNNPVSINWRNMIKTIPGGHSIRQYMQLCTDLMVFDADQASNMTKMKTYAFVTLPGLKTMFQTIYTNADFEAVMQMHLEDAGMTHFVTGRPSGNIGMGWITIHVMLNCDFYSMVAWMSLPNLFNGVAIVKPEYYTIKRLSVLYGYQHAEYWDFGIDGIMAVRCFNDDGASAFLIVNENESDSTVAAADVDGLTGSVAYNIGYALSLDDATPTNITGTTTDFVIKSLSSGVYLCTITP